MDATRFENAGTIPPRIDHRLLQTSLTAFRTEATPPSILPRRPASERVLTVGRGRPSIIHRLASTAAKFRVRGTFDPQVSVESNNLLQLYRPERYRVWKGRRNWLPERTDLLRRTL